MHLFTYLPTFRRRQGVGPQPANIFGQSLEDIKDIILCYMGLQLARHNSAVQRPVEGSCLLLWQAVDNQCHRVRTGNVGRGEMQHTLDMVSLGAV